MTAHADAPTRVQQASSDVCPEVVEKMSTSNAHQSYSSSAQSCHNETQTNTRPVHSMFVAKNSLKPMSNLANSTWQAVRAKERRGGCWKCEERYDNEEPKTRRDSKARGPTRADTTKNGFNCHHERYLARKITCRTASTARAHM